MESSALPRVGARSRLRRRPPARRLDRGLLVERAVGDPGQPEVEQLDPAVVGEDPLEELTAPVVADPHAQLDPSVEALDAAWVNVGHTTPDSLAFATEPEFEDVQSAQSDYPIRRFQTSESGSVSVDLLEWSGDLYGRRIAVEFVAFVRPDRAFDGAEALTRQMDADCRAIAAILDGLGRDDPMRRYPLGALQAEGGL